MPRKPREEVAGGLFHVYARGNDRRVIFHEDRDCELYVGLLAKVVQKYRWRCLTYCLMPNHIHLVVETPDPNLGAGMQVLHGEYARRFNHRYGACGHVFQGRYGAKRITTDAQLWTTVRYVARNPVEAALCRTPREWQWGGHDAIVSGGSSWLDAGRLLAYLGAAGGDPVDRYRELVEAA